MWILGQQYFILPNELAIAVQGYMTNVMKIGAGKARGRWNSHFNDGRRRYKEQYLVCCANATQLLLRQHNSIVIVQLPRNSLAEEVLGQVRQKRPGAPACVEGRHGRAQRDPRTATAQ